MLRGFGGYAHLLLSICLHTDTGTWLTWTLTLVTVVPKKHACSAVWISPSPHLLMSTPRALEKLPVQASAKMAPLMVISFGSKPNLLDVLTGSCLVYLTWNGQLDLMPKTPRETVPSKKEAKLRTKKDQIGLNNHCLQIAVVKPSRRIAKQLNLFSHIRPTRINNALNIEPNWLLSRLGKK